MNTKVQLPQADAVVITWAEAEWAAMEHVFCSSTTGMPYTNRTTGSWPGWIKYDQDAPSALGYWAYYGMYTSYNGALTAWAVQRDLFGNGPSPARVTSL